ncbi:HAD family hydrolase [Frateuria defendens]|uniref:HAD family hydrolase n=1 Tax=Frateuria defendens TaxID=2219559 RepID=UPI00069CF753|nr:HAD family phosphatase [Frateuria defendens]
MRDIRLVLFDLDDVLVDYSRETRVHHLAAALGCAPAAVHAAIYESGIETAADAGRLDAAAYLAALGDYLGRPVQAEDWVAARRAATRARPELVALAQALDARAGLGLLTNNGHLLTANLPRIVPELFPLFEGRAYASAQFQAAKPDLAVYLRCLEAIGAEPARTLFIDDNAANVEGARQAGLHGHRYTGLDGLRRALAGYELP